MTPLVSIVMTSYNHEAFLSDAIESVLAQTFQDFELIIVDDASSDSSPQIISAYQQKDARIRSVLHETNRGISITTNDGFAAATAEYLAYIQSDDLWLPGKLEKQIGVLRNRPNYAVWTDAMVIDGAGNPTGRLFTEKYNARDKAKSGRIFAFLSESNYICGQSLILKTAVARQIQFDTGLVYANDYKFMLELARHHTFYFIDEPLVHYRIHGDNSISKNKNIWNRDSFRISRYLFKRYPDDLSSIAAAKCWMRMGLHLHNQGHPYYAKKCFCMAIKNNPRKTSYYKKLMKSTIRNALKISDVFRELK